MRARREHEEREEEEDREDVSQERAVRATGAEHAPRSRQEGPGRKGRGSGERAVAASDGDVAVDRDRGAFESQGQC